MNYTKYFMIAFLLFSTPSFACQIKNSDYIFEYIYDNNVLEYKITNKNKEEFKIFQKLKEDISVGFIFPNKSKVTNKNVHPLHLFYLDNGYYFNEWYTFKGRNPARGYPLPKDNFKNVKAITGNFYIKDYINSLREDGYKWDLGWGVKPIKFKVKVILDDTLSTCLNFETKEYEYNFGSIFELI